MIAIEPLPPMEVLESILIVGFFILFIKFIFFIFQIILNIVYRSVKDYSYEDHSCGYKPNISRPFDSLKCPSCDSSHVFINDDGFEDCHICSNYYFLGFPPSKFEPTSEPIITIIRSNLIPAVSTPLIAGDTSKGGLIQ